MSMERELPSAVIPPSVEWTLRNARTKDVRVYEQSELSIEGEARLIVLGRRLGDVLTEGGYSWNDIPDVLGDESRAGDWAKGVEMVTYLAQYAPDLIAEAATVLLGVYPTNEDGSRNADYESERVFLRGALNVTRFVDMVRIFIAQNDYQRLIAPFSQTLAGAMGNLAAGTPASLDGEAPSSAPPEPSGAPSATPPSPSRRTASRSRSATAKASEPSPS